MNVFDQFTNIFSLKKTLRFELKPVGKTQQMLEEKGVFEKDRLIYEKYQKTKPFIDRMHREFIREAFESRTLSGLDEEYLQTFKEWKKDRKSTSLKDLKEKEKLLRNEILQLFKDKAKEWSERYKIYSGLTSKDTDILFKESVFESILKSRYGNDKEAFITTETGEKFCIFDSWKGFKTYFDKFFETRKNLYKDDGTSTALATRIIDQNLRRFCDNILLYEQIKDKLNFEEIDRNFGKPLVEVFSIKFYNYCLLQEGIDFYNRIIGGETLENGEKKKGLNEIINEFRQTSKEKISFFKKLDKQILSEKDKSFFIDEIESDQELFEILKNFLATSEKKVESFSALVNDFVKNNSKYNLQTIYISKKIFNKCFDSPEYLLDLLSNKNRSENKKDVSDFVSLNTFLEILEDDITKSLWKQKYYDRFDNGTDLEKFLSVLDFEFSLLLGKDNNENDTQSFSRYYPSRKEFCDLLKNFRIDSNSKIVIKNFADSVLSIYQFAKYFAVEKKRSWDTSYELDVFYTDPNFGYLQFYENAYEEIVQVYNKIRNYLTKKPYNIQKWKLNFEKSNLLGGFTESRTDKSKAGTQYGAYIFRKQNLNGCYSYFLGISKNSNLFSRFNNRIKNSDYTESEYERLDYYQVKVNSIYGSSYEGNYEQDKSNLSEQQLIEKLKQTIKKYIDKIPQFKSLIDKQYFKINDLKEDIKKIISEYGNLLICRRVSVQEFDQANSCKQGFYFFQIYSKDFSINKTVSARDNLHTLYLKYLLKDGRNILGIGSGEIFFRPKTREDKAEYKQDNKGKEVKSSKRYFEDKIFLHLSITLNRNSVEVSSKEFNEKVNKALSINQNNINIIGIDRGEKNLIYYTIINQKGEILKDSNGKLLSDSLNYVGLDAEGKPVNYEQKLAEKAKSREQYRKDWQTIENIKDLKKGYISQVVRKIADFAIQYNSIIVMEDLNMRFKQIRSGIEKSVYQQLEKALIDKLNFLVDKKETDPNKAGHVLKAYQLTASFDTFKNMGKQTGIIFYTQASYTSKIDPLTGWRPHFYLKYTNAENAKRDILNFSKIQFTNNRFEFEYDIKNFQMQKKEFPEKTTWIVCSNVERFRWNKKLNNNRGGYEHYPSVTDSLKELFQEFNIKVQQDILEQIKNLDTKGNEEFFSKLVYYFNLICQIRNTDENAEGDNQDFIMSPVEPFFDSRRVESFQEFGKTLPRNGDENGSYNIARKGIILLQRIKDNVEKPDLFIKDTQWDNFVVRREK